MRKFLKILGWTSTISILLIITFGFTVPFEDRDGKCTICGMYVFEKTSTRFNKPFLVPRQSQVSRYYSSAGLPSHEHHWEFLGGVTYTNLFSYPANHNLKRSDGFLIVQDEFLVQILERLSDNESRLELIRAINSDDEYIRDRVRNEIAMRSPGGIGGFMGWYADFLNSLDGQIECSILPDSIPDSGVSTVSEENLGQVFLTGPEFPGTTD
jgi:hypothetical protein